MAKKILLTLLFALIFVGIAASQPLTEQQKIEQLIRSVEQLKDAEFIRSGTAYSAQQAALVELRLYLSSFIFRGYHLKGKDGQGRALCEQREVGV